MENTKKCPFCAEEIKMEAVKCKHCGSMLDDGVSDKGNSIKTDEDIEEKNDKDFKEHGKDNDFQERISNFPEDIKKFLNKNKTEIGKLDNMTDEDFIKYIEKKKRRRKEKRRRRLNKQKLKKINKNYKLNMKIFVRININMRLFQN